MQAVMTISWIVDLAGSIMAGSLYYKKEHSLA
jgi:hypothetical protein